jgi:hypothetical protein
MKQAEDTYTIDMFDEPTNAHNPIQPSHRPELVNSTYLLPSHWACYFINDDETGYTDEELGEIKQWEKDTDPGWCLDVCANSEFTWRGDDGNYGADRSNFFFQREL